MIKTKLLQYSNKFCADLRGCNYKCNAQNIILKMYSFDIKPVIFCFIKRLKKLPCCITSNYKQNETRARSKSTYKSLENDTDVHFQLMIFKVCCLSYYAYDGNLPTLQNEEWSFKVIDSEVPFYHENKLKAPGLIVMPPKTHKVDSAAELGLGHHQCWA